MAEVERARQQLVDALREKVPRYWDLMKSWYKRKISKDEFDSRAKSLLGDACVHAHNEFLFAILVKCQMGAVGVEVGKVTSPVATAAPAAPSSEIVEPPAKKIPAVATPTIGVPYGALDDFQYHSPKLVSVMPKDLDTLLLCSHELLLPDLSTLHTRMLLGAWEEGLETVSEEAASMLMLALQYFLKMVISVCLTCHSTWQSFGPAGDFPHSYGHGFIMRETLAPSHSTDKSVIESEVMAVAARKNVEQKIEPINLFQIRDALKIYSSSISSHSVRACTIERVLAAMWHPSSEDDENKRTVQLWQDGAGQTTTSSNTRGFSKPIR